MKRNIFDEIKEMKEQHDAQIKDLKTRREECENEQREKENKAAEILEKGTPEEYAKAKTAAAEAKYKVEFFNKKTNELERTPAYKDPDRLIKDIMTYVENIASESLNQENAILAEAKEKAEERRKLLIRANECAQAIRGRDLYGVELMKVAARVRALTGELQAVEKKK